MADVSIVTTQVTTAAMFVYVMQKLKSAKWFPLLQERGQVFIKRGASILTAIGIHTGISHIWNPPGLHPAVAGHHLLLLDIPPLMVIAETVFHWAQQYVMQELVYQGTANRSDWLATAIQIAKKELNGVPETAVPKQGG